MLIREPKFNDAPQIAGLLRQLGYEMTEVIIGLRIAMLDQQSEHGIRVCEFEEKIVGCIAVHAIPLLGSLDNMCIITYLAIDEAYKNYAVDIRLEAYATDFARQHNCATLQFRCNNGRLSARRYYERFHYRQTENWMEKHLWHKRSRKK